MKILHFSDFHQRPNKQGERSMDLFNRMMDKLQEINQEAVLERHHDAVFAKKMNKKLIEGFNHGYLHSNFDGLCSILLEKYTDEVWNDFEAAFTDDKYLGFILQVKNEIGSGAGFVIMAHYQRESSIRFINSFVGRRWLDFNKALSLVIYSSFDRISW